MKKTKRFLAILASVLMLFTSVPSSAFAEDETAPAEQTPSVAETQAETQAETKASSEAKVVTGGEEKTANAPAKAAVVGTETDSYGVIVNWPWEEEGNRPDIDKYFNDGDYIQIMVKMGDADYVPLTDELIEEIGMDDPKFETSVDPGDPKAPTWRGNVKLPRKCTSQDGAAPIKLQWKLELTEKIPAGYKQGEVSGENPLVVRYQVGEKPDDPEDPAQPVDPEEPEVVPGDFYDYVLTAIWNDNNTPDARPEAENYFNGGELVKVMVSIDGEDPVPFTAEVAEAIGLEEVSKYSVASNFDRWIGTINLPESYTVSDEEDAHSLVWTFEYPEVDKYFSDITSDEGSKYNVEIEYTLKTDYSAKIQWNDNNNNYSSRPELTAGALLVYQYEEGNLKGAKLVEDSNITLTPGEDGVEVISIGDLPAYNKKGTPYQYYVVLKDDKSLYDEDGNLIAENNAGAYKILYENVRDNASDETRLFNEGTLDLTLQNTLDFTVKKVWNSTVEAPQNATLYLYRVTENNDGDLESIDELYNASPVQKFDSELVPYPNADNDGQKVFFITIKDEGSKSTALPMYDNKGNRYIYFALEKKMSNDYKSVITHDGAGDEQGGTASDYSSKSVINDIDNENSKGGSQFVLNRGVITNTRVGHTDTAGGKFFEAKAMQNMDAVVQMTLQVKTADGWVNARDDENNPVVKELKGFSQEMPGMSTESVSVPKYDLDGNKVEYRWVETGIQLNEKDGMIPVTFTEDENGNITYNEYNEGAGNIEIRNAPGVSGEKTTARFVPTQESNSAVKNVLVGDTQIIIKKIWKDAEGNNITDTEEIAKKTIKFQITRDGDHFTDVELSAADLVGSGADAYWEKVLTEVDGTPVPRYDAHGVEYLYDIKEYSEAGDPWTATYETVRSVVPVDGNYITQLETTVVNGPGEGLEFDVDKEWLDESDLETRVPVYVNVFERANPSKAVLDEPIELNEANNWFKKITITNAPAGATLDDYFIREVKVGAHGNTVDVKDAKDPAKIAEIATASVGGTDGTDGFANKYDDSRIIGVIDEGGACDAVHYKYDVFSTYNGIKGGRASYTVTNRRVGIVNLQMVKEWEAGGSAPAATFEVKQSVSNGSGNPSTIISFTLDPEKSTGEYLCNVTKPENVQIELGMISLSQIFQSPKQTLTVKISGLDKYAPDGWQYNYQISETGIYAQKVSEGGNPVPIIDGTAKVNGETFKCTIAQSAVDLKKCTNHHSDDLYSWYAKNTREKSSSMNAYKVWRDEGTPKIEKARPDIRYNLYRVKVSDKEIAEAEGGFDPVQYCVNNFGDAEAVVKDKLWDTRENDWGWQVDLGEQPRYDAQGVKYIYFIREAYPGNPGEYYPMYSNKDENVKPNMAKDVKTTKDVFDLENKDMYQDGDFDYYDEIESQGTGVLVLSVGEDNNYSRTVVNAKMADRTVSFRKIWKLPTGWTLPDSFQPEINVLLYRATTDFQDEMDAQQIHKKIEAAREAKDLSTFEPVLKEGKVGTSYPADDQIMQSTLKYPQYSDRFENLPKYDENGYMYYYYLYETPMGSIYSDIYTPGASIDGHVTTLTNTYEFVGPFVKVQVIKDWIKGIKKDNLRDAKFTLYAQQTDGNGNVINGTKVEMATAYVEAKDEGKAYTVFEFYQNDGKTKLPYYGPNGKPFKYSIIENVAPGYNCTPANEVIVELEQKLDEKGNIIYEGSVSYSNQYDGGKTEIKVQKKWNTYGYDEYILSSGIKVKVKRSWSEVTVNGKKLPGGSEYVYDQPIILNNDNNWTFEDKNLQKYAPNGSEYTYTVEAEDYVEYSDLMKTFFVGTASRTVSGNVQSLTYTNTLKTDKVNVTKNWTDQAGKNITKAQMQQFVKLGMMPEKMFFTLYRYTNNRESADEVGDYTYKDGNNTVSVKGTQEKLSVDAVGGANVASWDKLPKYDIEGNEYHYIVKEQVGDLVFWSDSTEEEIQTIIEGLKGATPSATMNSNTSGTVTTTSVAFTNKLDLSELYLKKVWDDNDNFDNTRPKDIKFYIASKDNPKEYTISLPHKSGNEWVSDAIVLPSAEGTDEEIKAILDQFIIVSEDEIKEGKYQEEQQAWAKDDDGIWFKAIVNSNQGPEPWSRTTTEIRGEKLFSGDKDWTDVSRPEIYLALYYKDRATGKYVPLTNANAKALHDYDEENVKEGDTDLKFGLVTDLDKYSIVRKANKANDWKVEWADQVYRYWYLNAVPGEPEAVEYKLFEVEPYTDNTLNGGPDPVIVTADSDFPYIVTYENKSNPDVIGEYIEEITNELKTTELSVKKIWEDSDNETVRPDEIKVKLVAKHNDGTVVSGFGNIEKSLNADNRWETRFENLPQFDKDSKKIVYSVEEVIPEELKDHYDMGQPVKVSDTEYVFEITNTLKPVPVNFNKVKLINESCADDPEAVEAFAGVEFTITDPSGTTSVVTSDAKGEVNFEVQLEGSYTIKETNVEEPFLLDGNVYGFEIKNHSWDGKINLVNGEHPEHFDADTNTIINDQVRGDFEFLKVDEGAVEDEDGNPDWPLAGAVFGLYDKNGKEIAKATSNDKGLVKFEGLITDKEYTVKELVAPLGYYISKYPIVVKLNNVDGEAKLQIVDDGHATISVAETTAKIWWTDPGVDLNILKLDPSGKNLAGAVLQVRDASGKVYTEWETSGDEDGDYIYMAGKLKVGETYYLHEVKAPKGYKIAKDVAFTVPNVKVGPEDDMVIKIKMVDPKIPDGPKTGDNFNIMFWAMLMILSLMGIGGIIAVPRLRRRER
ncbi:MAG: Cna B-type domain-containing protein [Eubacterium sp.]|nr:Cna B-type domain-containing protein [Candidatus Colimonas fimequi]